MHGVGHRLTLAEREEVEAAYRRNESSESIAKRLGVSGVAVRKTLRLRGVPMRGPSESHRIYPANEHVFKGDNPEVLYWVGALMSDGYVLDDGSVSLAVHPKDRAWVEALRDFLSPGRPLRDRSDLSKSPSIGVTVKSRIMADDLATWGVVPRKSKIACALRGAHESPDFWRGVIDGDGHIHPGKNCPKVCLIGSVPLTLQYKAFCEYIGAATSRQVPSKSEFAFTVNSHGNDAMTILRALYGHGGPALPRKRATAEGILGRFACRTFRTLRKPAP
jgi:hypothetical protein